MHEPQSRASNARLRAAREYAEDGRRVFPLYGVRENGDCECGDRNCAHPGKHPLALLVPHGVLEATTDARQINTWWTRSPWANIGLATGEASHAVVLDLDHGKLGLDEVADREMPKCPRQKTGNGEHRVFAWPGQRTKQRLQGNPGWPFKHCDFKGDGGYIVVAPSRSATGRDYEWLSPLLGATLPPMPDWLRELVVVREQAPLQLVRDEDEPDDEQTQRAAAYYLSKYLTAAIVNGAGRNDTGKDFALQLRDSRLTFEQAIPWMRRYQQAVEHLKNPEPPYTWNEAEATLRSIYGNGEPREPSHVGSGLPRIVVSGRPMREVEVAARHALEARQRDVSERERIYQQYSQLVWLREHTDKHGVIQPQISEIAPPNLAVELSHAADFFGVGRGRPKADGSAPSKMSHVMPPERVVKALALSREWRLDELNVVTSAPIVHADGSIVTTAGYDCVTRSFYWPRQALTLPEIAEQPTEQQAIAACDALYEPFADFPLDAESHTHALALLLTLILRRVFARYVPMAAITASDQGYGKTLLIDTCYRIASGAAVSYVSVPRTEEEWSKQIISWLTEGRDLIALDNVEHAVQSDELERVLTTDEYSRRALGTMQTATAPDEAVWLIAGNNLVLQGALPRRVYRIALSGLMDPLQRGKPFTHDPLLAWCDRERPRLLAAAYTLYRYWLTQGRPSASHGRVLTSFEP